MKNAGKITIALICIILALGITWTITQKAQAETTSAQTFVLPSSSTVTHTANTYIILWDKATGNLVDDNGAIAAGNTWTGGDIATAVHAQNGTVWTATIPALDSNYTYIMAVYDAAAPAKTDVPTLGPFLYDPLLNITYSDTNPVRGNHVKTVIMPYAVKSLSQRQPRPKDTRPSAYRRGYTKRWSRARKAYLRSQPLCSICNQSGRTELATVVDHIQPHRGDMVLFWDIQNWQGLCKMHHDQKTGRGL